jgi:hypothetical protein
VRSHALPAIRYTVEGTIMERFRRILKNIHGNLREILELVASMLLVVVTFLLFVYHLLKLFIHLLWAF